MSNLKEPPKRNTACGSPTASQYAKYEAKFMVANVFGMAIIFSAIALLFVHVIFPAGQEKYDRVEADLISMAQAAISYKAENDRFPDSLAQLNVFATNSSDLESAGLPSKDPWKQDYAYY